MSAWERNTFSSPNCKRWKGGGWSAVHRAGKAEDFLRVCWPCKTCMVISVKSCKILTCIDLHHPPSLNGGLERCSSRLKVQCSQASAEVMWKEIVPYDDCWISLFLSEIGSWWDFVFARTHLSSLTRRIYLNAWILLLRFTNTSA